MYNGECHKLIRRYSTEITRYDVCSIASKVYSKASSAENLRAAFRITGNYRFDPSAISNECVYILYLICMWYLVVKNVLQDTTYKLNTVYHNIC